MSKNAQRFSSNGSKPKKNQPTKKAEMLNINDSENVKTDVSQKRKLAAEFHYFSKNEEEKYEILRRIDVIRTEIIHQTLTPRGHPLLGTDFITYINLLMQLPIIVFVYKWDGEAFIYRPHFDYKKYRYSRGSLRLAQEFINKENGQWDKFELSIEDIEKPITKEDEYRLFQIFDTPFYIRCFLLDTAADDQPFYEVTARHDSKLTIAYEYARVCLTELLSECTSDIKNTYTQPFLKTVFDRISKIFDEFEYVPADEGRTDVTIHKKHGSKSLISLYQLDNKSQSFKKDGGSFVGEEVSRLISSKHEELKARFHNAIDDATEVSVMLKKYAQERYSKRDFSKDASNFFIMLRSYDRTFRRSQETDFRGYAYDTRISISSKQQNEIQDFITTLSEIGKEGYRRYAGVKNEFYGGYTNTKGSEWVFGRAKVDKKDELSLEEVRRNNSFARFAESLDKWFWDYLSQHKGSKIKLKYLLQVLLSPIGSESRSMVDPVFYYGSSIYRMPFRRDGGLERLNGLKHLYEILSDEEKEVFSFRSLSKIGNHHKRKELRRDCTRVLLFYYLTRLFIANDGNQEEWHTKVHLYPIDIGGVVVGVIGKASFDLKLNARKDAVKAGQINLPTNKRIWDEEILFHKSIVLPLRESLRRQYRSLQIEHLAVTFNELLETLRNKSEKEEILDGLAGFNQSLLNPLNEASQEVSRICPYPGVSFALESASDLKNDGTTDKFVELGDLRLRITQQPTSFVFRSLTKYTQSIPYDISRMLYWRFTEIAEAVLPIKQVEHRKSQ
jgi:hypothetical protein